MALFATVTMGAPAAAPSDVLESLVPFQGPTSDIQPVNPTDQTGNQYHKDVANPTRVVKSNATAGAFGLGGDG